MAKELKHYLKAFWHFIWDDDSIWSWIANIIIAFVLIKYIIFPVLGLILGSQIPIVAVVSGSMEHKTVHPCINLDQATNECLKYDMNSYEICGNFFKSNQNVDFDFFWKTCGSWYLQHNITREQFENFKFKNGFNTGDVMILTSAKTAKLGDTVVYFDKSGKPIIHRVVNTGPLQTKGDHNGEQIQKYVLNEKDVSQYNLVGKASLRIPFLGYIKILFAWILSLFGLQVS